MSDISQAVIFMSTRSLTSTPKAIEQMDAWVTSLCKCLCHAEKTVVTETHEKDTLYLQRTLNTGYPFYTSC